MSGSTKNTMFLKSEATPEEIKKDKRNLLIYDMASSVVSAILIITFIMVFLFRFVNVNGRSMESTLSNGDGLLVHAKMHYDCGDIVVISQPNSFNKILIKRVIATGGQTVDIDYATATVYVDGKALDEPYANADYYEKSSSDMDFPYTVPDGFLFCMGDNRNDSADSRLTGIGPIDERYILGKAFLRVVPFGKFNIYDYSTETDGEKSALQ